MSQLAFHIEPWIASSVVDPLERETLAPLTIRAGAGAVAVTEVYDYSAKTVREHINVPLYPLARWLVVNWWRLRWEASPPSASRSADWLEAHSMVAISGDTPWPPLAFSGDGESIQLSMLAEPSSDVATLRYTQSLNVEIPAVDFEAAVDELIDAVITRTGARHIGEQAFNELVTELRNERSNPEQAWICRQQAMAGLDPGSAPPEWLVEVEKLRKTAGSSAGNELLATIPIVQGGLATVRECLDAIAQSNALIDLRALPSLGVESTQLPWQRGAALAQALRQHMGIQSGRLEQGVLNQLIGVELPLPIRGTGNARAIEGGFRNGINGGKTSVLVGGRHLATQRFFIARLIAAALMSNSEQHLLPVTKAMTAFQKAERSFAQELLCPWLDLKAYVDEHGTDDDALVDAAEHFEVSEYVVRNTLVNKGYLGREFLRSPAAGS